MSQMAAAAEAAIRSRIGAVSGLQIEKFTTRIDTRQALAPGRRWVEVDISLTGWSCTLHSGKMRWRETADLRDGATGIEQARSSSHLFSLRIAKQMERLQQGIALGQATPLFSWMPTEEIDVMHLVMDREAASLLADGNREALINTLQESIMNLHQEPESGLRDEINGDQTVRGRTWTTGHTITDDALYYGDQLWVRQTLPETVLTACAGRRLGDVVAGLPERIGDRTVTSACSSADGDGTEFDFAADNATVQRILDEWSGTASRP